MGFFGDTLDISFWKQLYVLIILKRFELENLSRLMLFFTNILRFGIQQSPLPCDMFLEFRSLIVSLRNIELEIVFPLYKIYIDKIISEIKLFLFVSWNKLSSNEKFLIFMLPVF